jgi:hypothetical protein
MVPPLHLERRIVGNRLARLVDLAIAEEDEAGHDQRLGARPALGKAAIDKELVGTTLGHGLPYQAESRLHSLSRHPGGATKPARFATG